MNLEEIKSKLAEIGSTYDRSASPPVWVHTDPEVGKPLVKELIRLNNASVAKMDKRPMAWGARGPRGTIICVHCGKSGQEHGAVCDNCGNAL